MEFVTCVSSVILVGKTYVNVKDQKSPDPTQYSNPGPLEKKHDIFVLKKGYDLQTDQNIRNGQI